MSKIADQSYPRHTNDNPFPMTIKVEIPASSKKGKNKSEKMQVINEVCTCEHMRTNHHDSVAFGHGRCAFCACDKFTWHHAIQVPV